MLKFRGILISCFILIRVNAKSPEVPNLPKWPYLVIAMPKNMVPNQEILTTFGSKSTIGPSESGSKNNMQKPKQTEPSNMIPCNRQETTNLATEEFRDLSSKKSPTKENIALDNNDVQKQKGTEISRKKQSNNRLTTTPAVKEFNVTCSNSSSTIRQNITLINIDAQKQVEADKDHKLDELIKPNTQNITSILNNKTLTQKDSQEERETLFVNLDQLKKGEMEESKIDQFDYRNSTNKTLAVSENTPHNSSIAKNTKEIDLISNNITQDARKPNISGDDIDKLKRNDDVSSTDDLNQNITEDVKNIQNVDQIINDNESNFTDDELINQLQTKPKFTIEFDTTEYKKDKRNSTDGISTKKLPNSEILSKIEAALAKAKAYKNSQRKEMPVSNLVPIFKPRRNLSGKRSEILSGPPAEKLQIDNKNQNNQNSKPPPQLNQNSDAKPLNRPAEVAAGQYLISLSGNYNQMPNAANVNANDRTPNQFNPSSIEFKQLNNAVTQMQAQQISSQIPVANINNIINPNCGNTNTKDGVLVLFKPETLSLMNVYGDLMKKLTMTVLVPFCATKLAASQQSYNT